MLHEASTNIRVFADFPWLLSPAAAMFLIVLGLNLVLQEDRNPGSVRLLSADLGAGRRTVSGPAKAGQA